MSKSSQQQKEFDLAVLAFAQYLGIDIDHETDLIPIAKEALVEIPSPWEVCISNENDENIFIPFFYNNLTQESLWNHPYENIYIDKIKEERKYLKRNYQQKGGGSVGKEKKDVKKMFQLDDDDEDAEGDSHVMDGNRSRGNNDRSARDERGGMRGRDDRGNGNERSGKGNHDLVEVEEFDLIESDNEDKRRKENNENHPRGGIPNKGQRRDQRDDESLNDAAPGSGNKRGSRPASPIFGDDWLDTKKSTPRPGAAATGAGEERSRSQEKGPSMWEGGKERGRDDRDGEHEKMKNDFGRQRGVRDEWDDGALRNNRERGGNDSVRGKSQERERGRDGWRDDSEHEREPNWERDRERERERERDREREREQREQRERDREWEREREREREKRDRDQKERGQWSASQHPTIDTALPSQQSSSQFAPMTEPFPHHQQILSPPLSLPLYPAANNSPMAPYAPQYQGSVNGIAALEKERESAALAMTRFQSEINRLQEELTRERERHRGEIREMELVIASLKTSLQIAEENLQTERNLKKKSEDLLKELRKEMEGNQEEREFSLKSTLEENKRMEVDKITQKLTQESIDKVREVTLSFTSEVDREREVSRELRIRLIAEEDKVREVKREIAIVREEMELRGKQQLEILTTEKNDLQDKLRTQTLELQRVKEELTSMANRAATALQQAQLAKVEADAIRAESTSVISDGQTSHAALMQAMQRISVYETEIIRLKAEKASLQQELDSQFVEMRRWQDNSARGESKVHGTDAELKRVRSQAQAEAARYKSRLAELEGMNSVLNDQYQTLSTQQSSHEQEYERQIDRLEHELQRNEERVSEQETKMSEVLRSNHQLEREVLSLQDQLYKKERIIKEHENKINELKQQRKRDEENYEKEVNEYRLEMCAEKERCVELEKKFRQEMAEMKREVERKIPELVGGVRREIEEQSYLKIEREVSEREKRFRREKEEFRREMLDREERFQLKFNDLKRERSEERNELEKYRERCVRYEEKIEEMTSVIKELKENQQQLQQQVQERGQGSGRWRGGIRSGSYEMKRIGDGLLTKGEDLTRATYPNPHHHQFSRGDPMNLSQGQGQGQRRREEEEMEAAGWSEQQEQEQQEQQEQEQEQHAILSLNQQIAEMRQTLNQSLHQTKERNQQIQQRLQLHPSSPPLPPHNAPAAAPSVSVSAGDSFSRSSEPFQKSLSFAFSSPPRHHPPHNGTGAAEQRIYSPEKLFLSPNPRSKYSVAVGASDATASASASLYDFSSFNQSLYEDRAGGRVGGGAGGGGRDRGRQSESVVGPVSDSASSVSSSASSTSASFEFSLPTGGYHEGYWRAKYSKLNLR